jgi:uncharacterized membrane protein
MDESHKDAAPAPPSSDRRLADLVGLDRFGAFSDGVYAIAITLLVLELTVPEGPEPLGRALVEQWPEFLGYFISFAFIGGSWLTHARMTRLMRHADSAAAGLDLLILILIALLPFTTSLMVTHLGGEEVGPAVLIYGLNVLLASAALSLLLVYLGRSRWLLVDDVADDILAAMVRARWIAIAINVVAVAMAFALPLVAVGMYLAVTLLVLLVPLWRLRRRDT